MAVFTTGGFMKKSRFTESQIVAILKEAEGGIAMVIPPFLTVPRSRIH
jgi:hypothetical protein